MDDVPKTRRRTSVLPDDDDEAAAMSLLPTTVRSSTSSARLGEKCGAKCCAERCTMDDAAPAVGTATAPDPLPCGNVDGGFGISGELACDVEADAGCDEDDAHPGVGWLVVCC